MLSILFGLLSVIMWKNPEYVQLCPMEYKIDNFCPYLLKLSNPHIAKCQNMLYSHKMLWCFMTMVDTRSYVHHVVAGWNPITFPVWVMLKDSSPTVQLEEAEELYIAPNVDTTLELTCFIISPNKLLLTISGRQVNLYQLPQHAPIYIQPYTGHDNHNSPHRGQHTPVLLLFNLQGFSASSASLQGDLHIPA